MKAKLLLELEIDNIFDLDVGFFSKKKSQGRKWPWPLTDKLLFTLRNISWKQKSGSEKVSLW